MFKGREGVEMYREVKEGLKCVDRPHFRITEAMVSNYNYLKKEFLCAVKIGFEEHEKGIHEL